MLALKLVKFSAHKIAVFYTVLAIKKSKGVTCGWVKSHLCFTNGENKAQKGDLLKCCMKTSTSANGKALGSSCLATRATSPLREE